MEPIWRRKIKAAMGELGINRKELSRAIGRNERLIYDLLDATENPRIDTLDAVARALGHDMVWLFDDGQGAAAQRVPVRGVASAGEGWMVYDDLRDEIALATSRGQAIAIEVKGSSMAPTYRDGDILIGVKRPGDSAAKLIGLDCIIETETSEKYVKFLQPGTLKGRFNLRSRNAEHRDVENVRVQWVAPVEWVRRLQR